MHSQVLKEQLTKTRFVGLNFSLCVLSLHYWRRPEADTPRLTPPLSPQLGGCHTKTRG